MITTRDIEVLEFLETYKVANTSTMQELFFPSLSACQKRLKFLFDEKRLNRLRDNINNEYVYYYKKCPKQLKHSLLVTDFYRELHKHATNINFKIEPTLGNIRPDAVVAYIHNNKKKLILLEIEISNKGFDYEKYDKFYSTGLYREFFPIMPTVFAVGDNIKKIPGETKVIYKHIATNFLNIQSII